MGKLLLANGGKSPALDGLGSGGYGPEDVNGIGTPIGFLGVTNGSLGYSLLCGVPRRDTSPSVPGVLTLLIGANVMGFEPGAEEVIGADEFVFHACILFVAGLRAGPLPNGKADRTGPAVRTVLGGAISLEGICKRKVARRFFFNSAAVRWPFPSADVCIGASKRGRRAGSPDGFLVRSTSLPFVRGCVVVPGDGIGGEGKARRLGLKGD